MPDATHPLPDSQAELLNSEHEGFASFARNALSSAVINFAAVVAITAMLWRPDRETVLIGWVLATLAYSLSMCFDISAWRRAGIPAWFSGVSMAGFRMSPRSPPVAVTTRTCTPSATYLAMVAAPLLDSSSGWAWTAIKRSGSPLAATRIWGASDMSDILPGRASTSPRVSLAHRVRPGTGTMEG